MFNVKTDTHRKGNRSGQDRLEFLQKLVTEFQETDEDEDKEEVLANLANFAYDPTNYQFLRDLKVIDLFLDVLHFGPEKQASFAIGGLCNLCLDQEGAEIISNCLSSDDEEVVRNALTALMFLIDAFNSEEILSRDLFDAVSDLSMSVNPRVKNLAVVFLDKIFK